MDISIHIWEALCNQRNKTKGKGEWIMVRLGASFENFPILAPKFMT